MDQRHLDGIALGFTAGIFSYGLYLALNHTLEQIKEAKERDEQDKIDFERRVHANNLGALDYLLRQNKLFDIKYLDTVTNHLSMGLIAMYNLGAGAKEMKDFYVRYMHRLQDAPPCTKGLTITIDNWEENKGEGNYQDVSRFFRDFINENSISVALKTFMPSLADGLFTCNLSSIILLGYGVKMNMEVPVAEGLAHLVVNYNSVGQLAAEEESCFDEPVEAVGALNKDTDIGKGIGEGEKTLRGKMKEMGKAKDRLKKYDLKESFLTERGDVCIAEVTKAIGLMHRFTPVSYIQQRVPSNVTALHACKLLLPHLDKETQIVLIRSLWRAVCALHVVQGLPAIDITADVLSMDRSTSTYTPPDWARIKKTAIRSYDEHIMEFVYACAGEFEETGSIFYQCMAAFAIDL